MVGKALYKISVSSSLLLLLEILTVVFFCLSFAGAVYNHINQGRYLAAKKHTHKKTQQYVLIFSSNLTKQTIPLQRNVIFSQLFARSVVVL